ncbi:MAG: hypothetical protein JSW47_13740 [Phycisphaerales bacterium]|nr:MAG: hypothetical protein JSW47_13740 [Phycisphaerales bacterium]
MKRLVVLLLCSLSVCMFVGCPPRVEDRTAVEVIVDGGERFPDDLAGSWKADSGGWEIVIEPNGMISSAVVSLGRVRLRPGQKTIVPMKMDGKGVFEAGPWAVHYSHERRELTVEITIENFRVELGESVVKGRTMDLFTGTVSLDGRSWWASRFSFPEYVADTKKYRNHKLIVDPNETPPEELLFQKAPAAKQSASKDSH